MKIQLTYDRPARIEHGLARRYSRLRNDISRPERIAARRNRRRVARDFTRSGSRRNISLRSIREGPRATLPSTPRRC